jgi:processive 1,2-diacylglycerol beta-glucosyltransferase
VQCRVIELGRFLNPTVAPWILSAYRRTVSSQPKLVGMMYKTQYHKSLNRLTKLALHRIFYTHACTGHRAAQTRFDHLHSSDSGCGDLQI